MLSISYQQNRAAQQLVASLGTLGACFDHVHLFKHVSNSICFVSVHKGANNQGPI
jgi:hypothetical protein